MRVHSLGYKKKKALIILQTKKILLHVAIEASNKYLYLGLEQKKCWQHQKLEQEQKKAEEKRKI